MQGKTHKYSNCFQHGDEFYMLLIVLCTTSEIGITLSAVAIKSMTKADEWLAGLFKMYCKKGEEGLAGQQPPSYLLLLTTPILPQQPFFPPQPFLAPVLQTSYPNALQQGQGYTVTVEPPMPPGQELWGPVAPAPDLSLNCKTCGLAIPSSPDVIGVNMYGHSNRQQQACKVPGCTGKHQRHDCPKLFAETYPGCTMQGFNEKGARVSECWNCNEIKEATLLQWQKMQQQGFFVKDVRGNGTEQEQSFHFIS